MKILGDGEMARLIRELDWSRTPVGPHSGWPETLLAAANIMLAADVPMQIFLGPDLLVLYNDALRPAFAEGHPSCLGRPGCEVWKEIWPAIGERLQGVLHDGNAVNIRKVPVPLLQNGVLTDMYWNYSYSPIKGPDGSVLGVFDIAQDVTHYVANRRLLVESQAASVAIAERLSQFLEVTGDAVVGVDRNWTLTYLNPRAKELYDVTRSVTGRNLWEAFPNAVYEGSPYVQFYNRAMKEGVRGVFEAYYPEPLNAWLHVEVHPTRDGIVTFSRDITAQRSAEAAMVQTEKLAAVGRLAASIAHEINNPLEAVTNLLYLARGSADLPSAQHYLQIAESELGRVSQIASQTLRFYRQSSSPQEVTCQDLFASVVAVYRTRFANSKISLSQRIPSSISVTCFEGEIRQVLNNLVGNAIDATQPAGGRLLLRSRNGTNWKTGEKGVILTIADTGPGIPAQLTSKIFEAFYTTKGLSGTGLGLWVSNEIVNRHNGRLRLRSSQRPGHSGTVFTVFLPLVAAERTHAEM